MKAPAIPSSEAPERRARGPRRPADWVVPGPRPRGACGEPDLAPADDEDLSYLVGDFRIFQKKRGHRWSLDDFATAWVALEVSRSMPERPAKIADLGCGIGSVLQMMAWAHPEATLAGVEAQEISFGLAGRSLRWNGLSDRVELLLGDLREAPLPAGSFDLVTGTPPYLPIGHGLVSEKTQRGPCCFETRGGIEDYALAAARLLTPTGKFVVCGGIQPSDRGALAAEGAGLSIARTVDVIPKVGKPVLFRIFVMQRQPCEPGPSEAFVVRDAADKLTAAMHGARRDLGLPPQDGHASETRA